MALIRAGNEIGRGVPHHNSSRGRLLESTDSDCQTLLDSKILGLLFTSIAFQMGRWREAVEDGQDGCVGTFISNPVCSSNVVRECWECGSVGDWERRACDLLPFSAAANQPLVLFGSLWRFACTFLGSFA